MSVLDQTAYVQFDKVPVTLEIPSKESRDRSSPKTIQVFANHKVRGLPPSWHVACEKKPTGAFDYENKTKFDDRSYVGGCKPHGVRSTHTTGNSDLCANYKFTGLRNRENWPELDRLIGTKPGREWINHRAGGRFREWHHFQRERQRPAARARYSFAPCDIGCRHSSFEQHVFHWRQRTHGEQCHQDRRRCSGWGIDWWLAGRGQRRGNRCGSRSWSGHGGCDADGQGTGRNPGRIRHSVYSFRSWKRFSKRRKTLTPISNSMNHSFDLREHY